jgi:putative membrane protein
VDERFVYFGHCVVHGSDCGPDAVSALIGVASAHVAGPAGDTAGTGDFVTVALTLALAAALYLAGLLRCRRRSPLSASDRARACTFAAGLVTLWFCLLGPLDSWAAELFSAHMVQHEALMLIVAPLLVWGRPLPLFLWAFRSSGRGAIAAFLRSNPVRATVATLTAPWIAWLLHALVLWVWHVPRFFNAALMSRGLHDTQHLTFLVGALLFWTALAQERRPDQQGAAVLYLFTTTIHTSVLGALITFAPRPWYSSYLQTSTSWGLSALEDQQIAGLIMWVPASVVYVGAGLFLLGRWIAGTDWPVAGPPPLSGRTTGRPRQVCRPNHSGQ